MRYVLRDDGQDPLLYQEIYQDMISSKIYSERRDWDNLSDDVHYRAPGVSGDHERPSEDLTVIEREAYLSLDHCGRACEEQPRCFQYAHTAQECRISYSYQLGFKRDQEGMYRSGWKLERIQKDNRHHGCPVPVWK